MVSISRCPLHVNLYVTVGAVNLCSLSFGLMIGFPATVVGDLQKMNGITQADVSNFGSVATIGALFGSLSSGILMDKYGRKGCLLLSCAPTAIGWLLIYIFNANFISVLSFGRFLTGLGVGISSVCVPVYITEVTPKNLRGLLGSTNQLSITIGILLAYFLGYFVAWQILAVAYFFIPILFVLSCSFIYDTPRWYISNNRHNDAISTLRFLRPPFSDIEDECRDMQETTHQDDVLKMWDLVQKPQLFYPLKIALAIHILQQLTGINVILFYNTSIFASAGIKSPSLASMAIGLVQVIFTFCSCILIDKAGRRHLLLIGGFLMFLGCTLLSIHFFHRSDLAVISNTWSYLSLLSLTLFIIGFSIGWGPIPVLYASEIFPSKARGSASSLGLFVNWLTAFLMTKYFFTLVDFVGQSGVFAFLSTMSFIGIMFVYNFIYETKGRSLEDIELYFLGRSVRVI